MALLCSKQSGLFSAASTWEIVDPISLQWPTVGFASFAYTVVPGAQGASARSAAFTPGAITIDAIAVMFSNILTGLSPDLSLTVNLWNNTGSANVAGTSVTMLASDLPAIISLYDFGGGWVVCKLNSPVTLSGGTSYSVQCVSNIANAISLITSAASNNDWCRFLRTTTTKAPQPQGQGSPDLSPDVGDDLIVSGEFLDRAGSPDLSPYFSSYTVTMDNTSTAMFGAGFGSDSRSSLMVNNKGTLTFGTGGSPDVAFNLYLKISGAINVFWGGTVNVGTVANPIPRNSTAQLLSTNGGTLFQGSTFIAQGLSRTAGKNVTWCLMNADAPAGVGSISVDRDTGWLAGDTIVVGPSRSNVLYEQETLQLTGVTASTLTFSGNSPDVASFLSFPHYGTYPIQTEVINLTRNVTIFGAGNQVTVYNYCYFDLDWVNVNCGLYNQWWQGANVHVANLTLDYCAIVVGWFSIVNYQAGFILDNPVRVSNCVLYSGPYGFNGPNNVLDATNWSFDNCVAMVANGGFTTNDVGGSITNCRVSGSPSNGFSIGNGTDTGIVGTFNNLVAHTCTASIGFSIYLPPTNQIASFTNLIAYHNNNGMLANVNRSTIFDTIWMVGNTNANMQTASGRFRNVTMGNSTYNDAGAVSSQYGIAYGTGSEYENSTISVASGLVSACIRDVLVGTEVTLRNVTCAGPNEFAVYNGECFAFVEKHDGISGNNKLVNYWGRAETDTAIYYGWPPSLRLTPNTTGKLARIKLESAPRHRGMMVPVSAGKALVASAWMRKSSTSVSPDLPDTATYNGKVPRLCVRANPTLGIDHDTGIAAMSESVGGATWTVVSGSTCVAAIDGVLEFYFDCDGTAGWVNFDGFQVQEVTPTSYVAQVTSYNTAVVAASSTMTEMRKFLLHQLISGLINDGLWNKFDRIWVLANEKRANSLIDIKTLATATVQYKGGRSSGARPNFIPDKGWMASKQFNNPDEFSTNTALYPALRTGMSPGAASPDLLFQRNDASWFVWSVGSGDPDPKYILGNALNAIAVNYGGILYYSVNASAVVQSAIYNFISAVGAASQAAGGLFSASRNSSTEMRIYKNGVLGSVDAAASVALDGSELWMCGALFAPGSYASSSNNLVAAAGFGRALTAADHARLYVHLNRYMTAIGAK